MAEGTRGERMQQSKILVKRRWILSLPTGILQLPYQRTYYNGEPLGDFIVQ